MEYHEYANLFPMMADADLQRMADDIKENGQNDDIITHEGKILDGRNRFKACGIAGVDPRFTEYHGTEPLAFVISHNLHRRHLNEAQRGMVGAKLANLQVGNPDFKSKPGEPISAIAPIDRVTQKEAAEMLNVGVDSIKRSKQVMRTGIPELQDMQMSGEIAAVAAATVAKMSVEEQRKAVSGGVAGVKDAARMQKAIESASDADCDHHKSPSPESNSDSSLPQNERIPKWIPNDAERLWVLAKNDLSKILPNDKSRERVLMDVIEYAQNRIDTKK